MVEGAYRAEQEQRFGVDGTEEQREWVCGQQPGRGARAIVIERIASDGVKVHESTAEGCEGDQHAGGDIADHVPAQDSADDPNQHRIRREEHDVLLRGRVERRVLVAVRHDLQVPAGVPTNGQVQQLVGEMTERRVTLRVSEHEDGQVADEQDDGPRAGERGHGDATPMRMAPRWSRNPPDNATTAARHTRTTQTTSSTRTHGGTRTSSVICTG